MPTRKGRSRYVQTCTCRQGRPLYHEYHGPIITNFTGLVGILVWMIIPIFVWRSPKGRCYGNKFGEHPYNYLGVFAVKTRNFCAIARNFTINLHSSIWHSEMDWKIVTLISQ